MAKYTEIKTALDEIAARSVQNMKRRDQAKQMLGQAQSDLAAMATAYGQIATAVDAAATANPSNAAWLFAKAEKDRLVADFIALKAEIDTLVTAVNA